MKEGKGLSPDANDSVTVHYEGRFLDGRIFDSSRERGVMAVFTLNMVIPGWSEGLQMMKEGARYRLYVPAELGYGKKGAPPKIGPDAALVFEVELFKVEKR